MTYPSLAEAILLLTTDNTSDISITCRAYSSSDNRQQPVTYSRVQKVPSHTYVQSLVIAGTLTTPILLTRLYYSVCWVLVTHSLFQSAKRTIYIIMLHAFIHDASTEPKELLLHVKIFLFIYYLFLFINIPLFELLFIFIF